jgi:hypothetical protein
MRQDNGVALTLQPIDFGEEIETFERCILNRHYRP